jgi:sugar phosphate isomerase/epimerase
MKFYISSQCSPQKRIGAAVAELAGLGFSRIELTGGTEWYPELAEDLPALGESHRVELLVHNYFPPQRQEFVLNLAVKDRGRRRQMKTFIQEALTLSKRFGNSVYGVHPGFRQDVAVEKEANGFFKVGDAANTSIDAFYAMLDELNELATVSGMQIAVENLAPRSADDHFSFLTNEADIERFLGYVQTKSHLGLLVDFGHLGAAAVLFQLDRIRLLDRIFAHPEKILEIHLSENDGPRDAHGVTPRDSWQLQYLQAHRSALRDTPVVLEWLDAARPATFERSQEIVRDFQSN